MLPEELRGVHRVEQRAFLALYPRLMIVLAAVAVALNVRAESWPPAVLWGVLLPAFVVAEVLRRRERIELHAAGFTVHGGLRPKHVAWDDVQSIRPPDRWRGEALITLDGHREISLRGADDETARALAGWFDETTSTPR